MKITTEDLSTKSFDELVDLYKNGYRIGSASEYSRINNLAVVCNEGCKPASDLYLWFAAGYVSHVIVNLLYRIKHADD